MTEPTAEPEDLEAPDPHAPDGFLRTLVAMASQSDEFGVGITVLAEGTVVSGVLVGRNVWFKRNHDNYIDTLGSMLRPFLDAFEEEAAAREDDSNGQQFDLASLDSIVYIHLVDAHYLLGGDRREMLPTSDSTPLHWRGRLSKVSGWSFGTLK